MTFPECVSPGVLHNQLPIFQSEVSVLDETRREKKGNSRKTQENNARRKNNTGLRPYPPIVKFHSGRLWWGVSLPLPGEIVTADISRCGNGGASVSATGGGREMKNAVGKVMNASCRNNDDLKVWVSRERWFWSGPMGPIFLSYDPAMAGQPAEP